MTNDPAALAAEIRSACAAMGFARSGVAPARPTRFRAELLAWLDAGKHGDMAYLTELLDQRTDVRALLPGARSVVMVADVYASTRGGGGARDEPTPGVGRVARYARGSDYHAVVKDRLHALCDRLRVMFPKEQFRAFVDTGPALERELAALAFAGDGPPAFIGKHTLVIDSAMGSWFVLGGVATTLDLAEGEPPSPAFPAERCGTCTRCIDACPTGAITPWSVDARRCVSYLTLEHRGEVDPALFAGVGDRLLGCDVCQEVCPYNAPGVGWSGRSGGGGGGDAPVNPAYTGERAERRAGFPLLEVLGWSEADRSRELSNSAGKRASLEMLRRTAVINAGNTLASSWDAALHARVVAIAGDEREPASVRAAARAVVARLESERSRVGPSR
jgi:epoxyqueuosine reductase